MRVGDPLGGCSWLQQVRSSWRAQQAFTHARQHADCRQIIVHQRNNIFYSCTRRYGVSDPTILAHIQPEVNLVDQRYLWRIKGEFTTRSTEEEEDNWYSKGLIPTGGFPTV